MSNWLILSDWMANIPDKTNLADMSIPGTHDSGAEDINLLKSLFAKTQGHGISNQLMMGNRFLDIRLKLEGNNFKVYHGGTSATSASCHLNFSGNADGDPGVMDICKQFLKDHIKETIIMSLKEEIASDDFDKKIREAIEADGELWYRKETFPSLGSVRGRIVLIRRWDWPKYVSDFGIDASPAVWKNNSDPFMIGKTFCIQDNWNPAGGRGEQRDEKWKSIEAQLKLARSTSNGSYFFINFLSANTTPSGLTPNDFATANGSPDGMLARTQNYVVQDLYGPRIGAILIDFAGADGSENLIPAIVGRNRMADDGNWTVWASNYFNGFANPKMYAPAKINGIACRSQLGFGITNLQFGFLNPSDNAQQWTDWQSTNANGDIYLATSTDITAYAVGMIVYLQGEQYGIVDIQLIMSDGTNLSRLTNNSSYTSQNQLALPSGKSMIGARTQEWPMHGLINIQCAYFGG